MFNLIGWCHFTINFWWGCTEVSPACRDCYARTMAVRMSNKVFGFLVKWGNGHQRGQRLESARLEALALNRTAARKGVRYRIFANSMSDWLDDQVPAEWLAFLLETIRLTPHLDWLLLTKRPEKWKDRLIDVLEWGAANGNEAWRRLNEQWVWTWRYTLAYPENVWIGYTGENQDLFDKRTREALLIPCKVRYVSMEPLLSHVDMRFPAGVTTETAFPDDFDSWSQPRRDIWFKDTARTIQIARSQIGIHWVIAGGESGKKARPSHPDWFRSLRDQCAAAGVPFYFKQWGEFAPHEHSLTAGQYTTVNLDSKVIERNTLASFTTVCSTDRKAIGRKNWVAYDRDGVATVLKPFGTKKTGRLLDGVEHNGFPS